MIDREILCDTCTNGSSVNKITYGINGDFYCDSLDPSVASTLLYVPLTRSSLFHAFDSMYYAEVKRLAMQVFHDEEIFLEYFIDYAEYKIMHSDNQDEYAYELLLAWLNFEGRSKMTAFFASYCTHSKLRELAVQHKLIEDVHAIPASLYVDDVFTKPEKHKKLSRIEQLKLEFKEFTR